MTISTVAQLWKSGKVVGFYALNNSQHSAVTAVSSDPTIVWQGNTLSGLVRTWGDTNHNYSLIAYALNVGSVVALNLTQPGVNYVTPVVTASGGGGTGLTFGTPTLSSSKGVGTCTITAAGIGYTSNPTVTISGGGGTGARAQATVAGGVITNIAINFAGTGYTGNPTVTLSGGGSTTFVVTNPGSGYTSAPTVTLSGGGGGGATAVASINVALGTVTAVTITSVGSGYTSTPTVSFSGGGGSNAAATVSGLFGGSAVATFGTCIAYVPITSGGSGYTSLPTISISDAGGGTGAVMVPFMSGASSSDTLTFTASASWYTCAAGSAPANVLPTSIANSAGALEPGIGGVPGFNIAAGSQTMPVGYDNDFNPNNFHSLFMVKNLAKRLQNPMVAVGGSATFLEDGTPVTLPSGGYIHGVFVGTLTNFIDTFSIPNPCGCYTIQYDESVTNNMKMWLYSSNSQALASSIDLTAGPSGAGNAITRTNVGGVVTVTYNIQRAANPTSWAFGLNLGMSSANGSYTASNLWIFAPGETLDRSNPLALSDGYIAQVTAPNGNVPYALRSPQQLAFDANLSCVDASDLRVPSDFTWSGSNQVAAGPTSGKGTSTIPVVAYRYWNCSPDKDNVTGNSTFPYAATPNIYSKRFGLAGTDAFGPYMGPNYSGTAPNRVGDNGAMFGVASVTVEFRTSVRHLLRTGDMLTFPNTTLNFPISYNNSGTQTLDGLVHFQNVFGPAYVTSEYTFLVESTITTGQSNFSIQHNVDISSSTAETAVSFNLIRAIPDCVSNSVTLPPEFIFAACAQLGCKVAWINTFQYMTLDCITHIANLAKPYTANGMKIVHEHCNEAWNTPYVQAYTGSLVIGHSTAYWPNNTAFSQYFNTVNGTNLSQDRTQCLITAQNHDAFEAVVGKANMIRMFGVQFDASSHSAAYIGFAPANAVPGRTAVPIPIGALGVAPYLDVFTPATDVTFLAAFNAAAGNWAADALSDLYRHCVLYSVGKLWTYWSGNYTNALTYAGATGYPGQIAGIPGIVGYECSPEFSSLPSTNFQLSIDMQSGPAWADVRFGCLLAMQNGMPYTAGSGLEWAQYYLTGGDRGGTSGQQPWSVYGGAAQFAGPQTIGVNTVTSQATTNGPPGTGLTGISMSGVAASPPLFTTWQGAAVSGGIADGRDHTLTNDSPAATAYSTWTTNSNFQPLTPPNTFSVSPTSVLQNQSSPVTLTLTGSGTSWTSGSTVTIQNSVTGTTTVTKGTWTDTSGTAATLTITTGAGAGTFTITVDGVVSPSVSVSALPTLTVNPTSVFQSTSSPITLTLTGSGTSWTSGSTVTIQNSVTGTTTVTKGTWTDTSGTAATLTITTGAGVGTFTITVDGTVSPSLSVTVTPTYKGIPSAGIILVTQ